MAAPLPASPDPRFTLLAPLGEGGMGTVFRALDRLHGREVALKLGRPGAGPDPSRIAEEFALLSTLDHPRLVRVLDLGHADGRLWLSSELVDGPRLDTWASRLARAPDAAPRLEALVAALLEALAWLHARGLVHGDLKPANVLVRGDAPVLIDFGLAGERGALLGGTRPYLAPELLAGAPTTPASDLFALGRTLERVALPQLTPALAALLPRLTAPRPEDRPTTLAALAALAPDRAPEDAPNSPESPRARPWSGAIDRLLHTLHARTSAAPHLRLACPPSDARPFLGALAAHLMLTGARAWLLPEGEGLAPLLRLGDALGLALPATAASADDQREALDVLADAFVAGLRTSPAPTLLVPHPARLGPAGRFVLARLVEAHALPSLILAGEGSEQPLERGVDRTFTRLEVQSSEATGRDWLAEWRALPPAAQAATAGLLALGGRAHPDELLALAGPLNASPDALMRGLAALSSGLTERAEAGRTALAPAFHAAAAGILPIALTPALRRAALDLTLAAPAPPAPTLLAAAQHALALAPPDPTLARDLAPTLFERAARRSAEAFLWADAGAAHLAAARAWLDAGLPTSPERAFRAAADALRCLRAAGGGPTADALAVATEAARLLAPEHPERALEAQLLEARARLEQGRPAEAADLACNVALHPLIPESLRFEAHLIAGTALAQTEDKARAEAELTRAAALAEARHDDHALGRTANNLGLLAFHRGDLPAAAAAWARATAAKQRTGDRRGERIGWHNQGLALRELGRLEEAARHAERAAALAEQIGDQVGRATAALARAQLALDRDLPADADLALAAFDRVPWRPAMVEADARLVRVRRALLTAPAEAARLAREALDLAVATKNEPVAAEAWALLVVATRAPEPPPPLVEGPLGRAPHERGGLATLLLIAGAFADAELGHWDRARAALAELDRRLPPGPLEGPALPPAARPALPLLLAAARLVAPELAARLTPAPAAHLLQTPPRAAPQHALEAPDLLMLQTLQQLAHGAAFADLAAWPAALRAATGASRCELVLDGAGPWVDAEGPARFAELGRKVATTGRPFVARGAEQRLEVLAEPLRAPTSPASPASGPALGAAVLAFDPPLALAAPTLGPVVELLALAAHHHLAAARDTQREAELTRLRAELDRLTTDHEAEVTALRDALEQSQSALALRYDYGQIVHRSTRMRRVLETLDKVTDRDLPVLILGESGVGKELLARALHFNGPRRHKRFIAENCGAIPKDLFESHFFGHVKGAYTGALSPKQGLFEAADGGTLFLDEVGELPLDLQVKLLRVLQDKKVRPVGSTREIPVDVRVVAATNRDLAQMVAEGRFREDLFYRVAVVKVDVPPLRERPEDILPIAQHLLQTHGERLGRAPKLGAEAIDRLTTHAWPGNVRELENELLRALALCEGPEIKPRHFSPALARQGADARTGRARHDEASSAPIEPLEATLARVERDALRRVLLHTHGQKLGAAKLLGLSRPGLDAKLARHGLDAKQLGKEARERQADATSTRRPR